MSDPCPNCSAVTHLRCCARCGALLRARARRAGRIYCTDRCAKAQTREDEVSWNLERESQS